MLIDTLLFGLNGATIDCGCQAAVVPVVEAFRLRGVVVEATAARAAPGVTSREQVRLLSLQPRVRSQWIEHNGAAPSRADLDQLHGELEALLLAGVGRHAIPIPGFLPVLAELRAQGMRTGATTSFPAEVVEVLRPAMAARGWRPDTLVSGSEVPAGPPAPYLHQFAAMRLGSTNVARCVVAAGIPVELEAARNAGMWAIGLALTGPDVGLTAAELGSLHRDERARLAAAGKERLEAAGAHVVVDTVADLSLALDVLRRPSMMAIKRWRRPW